MKTLLIATCCAVALVTGAAGCAALPWMSKTHTDLVLACAERPVNNILCIWQPAEGRGMDNLPTRGFAGQIFFFTHGTATPIVGNGEVDVFLFDDQGTPEQQAKPLHAFEFAEDAWNGLLRQTQMGPAYSVFIPYVRKGRHHAQCALVVRLKPREGSLTSSNMVYVTLRGPKEDQAKDADEVTGSRTPSNGGLAADQVKTLTVPTPDRLVARLTPSQQSGPTANVLSGDNSVSHQLEQTERSGQLLPVPETPVKRFRLSPSPSNETVSSPNSAPASQTPDVPAAAANRPREL